MPFKSKAQQRFMFAAEERGDLPKGTAKKWADHTKNIKSLPEHVKKAMFEDKLANLLFEKVSQAPQLFSQAAADSVWGATAPLGRQISDRYSVASGIVSKITGRPVTEQVPSAGLSRDFLQRSFASGKIAPSDTGLVRRAIGHLSSGESGARSIMDAGYWKGLPKAVPFTYSSLANKPVVDSALGAARKAFPQDFSAYSGYLKNKTGQGWKGDTTAPAQAAKPAPAPLPPAPAAKPAPAPVRAPADTVRR